LAGSGAVVAAFWPNADAVASMVAMATIVVIRMSDAPGVRRDGADVEINKFGRLRPKKRDRT
jgi:ribosomal protein S12